MAAIEARNVGFFYGGEWVIKDISFSLEIGEFLGVEGPNGGGKSTLIKILAGALTPSEGNVFIFGKTPNKARGLIGYMPQENGGALSFPIRAIDVVKMGFLASKKRDEKEALEALEKLGAAHLARKKIGELSGGERRKVLIARAIVGGVKAALLDEPTAGIDEGGEIKIAAALKELKKTTAIVCVSHDRSYLQEAADRIISIRTKIVRERGFGG
ncbi:MAG: metal ABC transporter ATP-binding protein [Helicobacteraceae bacterium]|jgi:zinc transport system ATP-binding protein|nr:metal ABC transporter ATP-binding protein [Helicobacteraceae bacterium]